MGKGNYVSANWWMQMYMKPFGYASIFENIFFKFGFQPGFGSKRTFSGSQWRRLERTSIYKIVLAV